MRQSRSHGFIAWFFDTYALSIALGSVVALLLAVTSGRGSPALGLGLFAAAVLATAVYHRGFATRLTILTPGELMAGRTLVSGGKQWMSPYSKTRVPLFALILLTIVMAGNAWDGIADGATFGIVQVVARSAVAGFVIFCLVAAGRGHASAMIGAAFYWLALAATVPRSLGDAPGSYTVMAVFALPALPCLLVAVLYARWRFRGETVLHEPKGLAPR